MNIATKGIGMHDVRLTVINGSTHSVGATASCLEEFSKHLQNKFSINSVRTFNLSYKTMGCIDCGQCTTYCRFRDDGYDAFRSILQSMEESEYVLFGTPVYLDMPTGPMVSFLTRLNCMAENTNRQWFANKKAFFLATAYCSGTKSAINIMRGASEMLGFTIPSRSSREYIKLWKDTKIRGGVQGEEIFLNQ